MAVGGQDGQGGLPQTAQTAYTVHAAASGRTHPPSPHRSAVFCGETRS